MPSNPIIREIPRAKLMEVFKTPELVKLFEGVLFNISTTIPTGIDDVTGIADAARATAETAQANLNAHITDATDAHDASAVSVVPVGAIVATDVQAALAGLDAILALRGTLYSQNANAVAITGGAVNGTAIGATTPASGKFTTVETTGVVRTDPTTVASLPPAASAGAGARSFVTDASAASFLTVVAGGGANAVPVVCDGTNWRIG